MYSIMRFTIIISAKVKATKLSLDLNLKREFDYRAIILQFLEKKEHDRCEEYKKKDLIISKTQNELKSYLISFSLVERGKNCWYICRRSSISVCK